MAKVKCICDSPNIYVVDGGKTVQLEMGEVEVEAKQAEKLIKAGKLAKPEIKAKK